MKLLFCKNCYDIFRLFEGEDNNCKCGKSGGRYIDCVNAEYWGAYAVPIGIANISFVNALQNIPEDGLGPTFEAFVIPKDCESFRRVDMKE